MDDADSHLVDMLDEVVSGAPHPLASTSQVAAAVVAQGGLPVMADLPVDPELLPQPVETVETPSPATARTRQTYQAPDRLNRHDACRTCRLKKRKCDGRRPVCNRCMKAAMDGTPSPKCVYDERIVNVAEEVSGLHGQMEQLLEDVRDMRDRIVFLERMVLGREANPDHVLALADARRRGSSAPPTGSGFGEKILGKRKAGE